VSGSDAKAKLITGMVGAQLPLGPPGSPAKPYLTGGVGITNFDFDSGSPGISGSSSDFMIGGGGGVMFSLGSLSLFVEARIMNAFTENSSTTFLPITGGILFGGK
jgi:opacity protein-like surface antigen